MVNYEKLSVSEVQKLARQGDKEALFEMAYRYPDNEEAPGMVWAIYWMEKAANRGHVFAKRRYADMIMKIRSDKFAENRQKAMSLFESLVKDFEAGKLNKDDRSVGMVAKIELGIMLCEGVGTPRNHKRGLKLIKEGEENMEDIGGLQFAHLVRIGELYASGYAQEDEEPTRTDLVRAIEYLGSGIRSFKSDRDDAKMFHHAQQLLDIQEKQLPNKRALEEKRAGLEGLPQEIKDIWEKEHSEYNEKEAKERRKKLEQPTEIGRQSEEFLRRLRKRLAKEYGEDNVISEVNKVENVKDKMSTFNSESSGISLEKIQILNVPPSKKIKDIIAFSHKVEKDYLNIRKKIGQLEQDYQRKHTDVENRKKVAMQILIDKREKLQSKKDSTEKKFLKQKQDELEQLRRHKKKLEQRHDELKRFKETQREYINKVHKQIEIKVADEKRNVLSGLKREYENLKQELTKAEKANREHSKKIKMQCWKTAILLTILAAIGFYAGLDFMIREILIFGGLAGLTILYLIIRLLYLGINPKKMTIENILVEMKDFRERHHNCFDGETLREPSSANFNLNLSQNRLAEILIEIRKNFNHNYYSFNLILDKINNNMPDFINDNSAEYLADIETKITDISKEIAEFDIEKETAEINNEIEQYAGAADIKVDISKINEEIDQKNVNFSNEDAQLKKEFEQNREKIIEETALNYQKLIRSIFGTVDEYRVVSSALVSENDVWRISQKGWEQLPDRLLEQATNRKQMDHLLAGKKLLEDVCLPVFVPWQQSDGNMPGQIVVRYAEGGKDASIALVNNLMMRMIASFDPGCIRFSFIDPLTSGDSRYMINKLSDDRNRENNVRLFYEKAKSSPDEIGEHLRLLKNKMEEVQKGVGFARNIIEYNLDKNNLLDYNRPYEVIVVYNFHKLGNNYMEHLTPIIEYGCRWGFYLIALCPQATGDPNYRNDFENIISSRKFIRFHIKDSEQAVHRLEYFNSTQQIEVTHDFWLLDSVKSLPDKEKSGLVASNAFALNSEPIDAYFNKVKENLKKLLEQNKSKSNLGQFNNEYHHIKDDIRVPVGESANKTFEFVINQEDSPHTFVMGKPGSGKSVLLHDIITGAVLKYSHRELELYLMDFKQGGVEFNSYAKVDIGNDETIPIPHIRAALLDDCDLQIAVEVLEKIVKEMGERGKKFSKANAKKLTEYNAKVKEEERKPSILIVIDECQRLFGKTNDRQKRINAIVEDIARQGRNQGIHLIFATQTLVGTDMPDVVLKNIANKYILKSDKSDAGKFLYDAEKLSMLEKQGAAIYVRHNEAPQVIQPDFLPEKQINEWLKVTVEKSKKLGVPFEEPFIFSGKQEPYIDEVADNEWSDNEPMTLGRTIKVERQLTNIPIHKRDGGRNLLIIGNTEKQRGQAENNALRIVVGSMFSLAQHYRKTGKPFKIYVINHLDRDENKNVDIINSFACDNIVFLDSKKAVEKTFLELTQLIDNDIATQEDTYLYIIGQHKFRDLINNNIIEPPKKQVLQEPDKQTSGASVGEYLKVEAIDMGFGSTAFNSTKPLTYKSCLENILKNGNDVGIHVVLQVDSLSRFFLEDNSNVKNLFRYMALLAMPNRDTDRLTKTNDKLLTEELSSDPERVRAFFFEDTASEYPAFVPFVLSQKEFIKQIINQ